MFISSTITPFKSFLIIRLIYFYSCITFFKLYISISIFISFKDVLIIISSDTDLTKNNIEEINKISNSLVNIYDNEDNDTQITINLFSSLNNNSEFYEINTEANFYEELGEEKLNSYNNILKKVSINTNNSFIYAIGAEIRKCTEKAIYINTINTLDNEKCSILNKIPFKKILSVSISKDDYTIVGKNIKLKSNYNILTKSGAKSVNVLKPGQYTKLVNDKILFFAFTDEDIWNKLKAYRLLTGYSSHYLATLLGIRKESYRLLEIGHNKLTTHQMWKIENKLGILLECMIDLDKYSEKFSV